MLSFNFSDLISEVRLATSLKMLLFIYREIFSMTEFAF